MDDSRQYDNIIDYIEVISEEMPGIDINIRKGWWSDKNGFWNFMPRGTWKKPDTMESVVLIVKKNKRFIIDHTDNSIDSFSDFITNKYNFEKAITDSMKRLKSYCDRIGDNVEFRVDELSEEYYFYIIFRNNEVSN